MQIEDSIQNRVRLLLEDGKENLGHALGIRFISIRRNELKAEMPVDHRTVQPMRILHGGASVALAESLMSIGAWVNLENPNERAVGLEINANHIRSVKEGGTVTGVAKPIHIGRSTQVWQTKIFDGDNKLVSLSRCTLSIITVPPEAT